MSAGNVRRDPGREPVGRGVRAHIRVPGGVLASHASTRHAGPQRAAAFDAADPKLAEHGYANHVNHDEQLPVVR